MVYWGVVAPVHKLSVSMNYLSMFAVFINKNFKNEKPYEKQEKQKETR